LFDAWLLIVWLLCETVPVFAPMLMPVLLPCTVAVP
jgi:hypothetical protein